MNKEELIALGLSDDVAEQVLAKHAEEVSAEKEHGVSSYRKKDEEAKALRSKLKATYQKLGIDEPDEAKVDEFLSAKQQQEKTALEEVQALRSELENERTALKTAKIRGALTDALNGKVVAHDFVVDGLLARGVADVDGDNIVVDGKPIADWSQEFISSRSDIAITKQETGTGGEPAGEAGEISLESLGL